MTETITEALWFFVAITLINIVSSTVKSVLIIKSTPISAGVISALNYTINAVAVLATSHQTAITVIVTAFCGNLIGVTATKFLMDKLEKDRLWVYNATIKCTSGDATQLRSDLKSIHDIHSTWEPIVEDQLYSMKFFVHTKEQSTALKDKLHKLDSKYYIIEPR